MGVVRFMLREYEREPAKRYRYQYLTQPVGVQAYSPRLSTCDVNRSDCPEMPNSRQMHGRCDGVRDR